ncbi:MAG: gliding motility-associated C-terminal domain-containing protein [Cryomorphaceae bacterium]
MRNRLNKISVTFNLPHNQSALKRFILSIILLFFGVATGYATHNRAGAITYVHIAGNTYEITVKTCTKTSAPADRPFLPISWGDGSPIDSLEREDVIIFPGNANAQENIYRKVHTFPGAGTYEICVSDPNRNAGVQNISNSVLVPFAIKTTLRISAAIAPNNSVYFTNSCLQDACIWQPWVYNPGAVDPDPNDSLVFRLVPSQGPDCVPLPDEVYEYPNEVEPEATPVNPNTDLTIDSETGTIIWDSPQKLGEYNLAFIVEEWRNGILIGTVLFDMQITVDNCDNTPPEIEPIQDTCVEAGQTLNVELLASDNEGDNIEFSGLGAPFNVSDSPAEIVQDGTIPAPGEEFVDAEFVWNTNCSHVQLSPFQATIQATDNGSGTDLVAIETFNITVVAPAPENLVAEPLGSSINLSWDPSICDQAVAYKIYRRINPYGFIPDFCETGVPEYTGYVEIATVEGHQNTTYTDDDEIIFGRENCYMVVACFADGAESYASEEICAEIRFEIPIIKKNSVGVTAEAGVDTVMWRGPIELDLDVFPGPYQYRLLRSTGYGQATELVLESDVEADLNDLPDSYISDNGDLINTRDTAHTYRVELYSNGELAAESNLASSLYLELIPNDNQMEITWREELPWLNFEYDIYRQTDEAGDFDLIATSDTVGYVDTGLVNNRTYCYYIVSRGSYFAVEENDTLINYSQQVCAEPYDRTPPCPPQLTGDADCVEFITDLEWTNPNLECEETDDVLQYNIYYTPVEGGEFELIETIDGATNNFYERFTELTVAGCYAITALDSISIRPDGQVFPNESEFSNIICFDNCPEYTLPNVFTPNGDGRNDIFEPFPYRSVESIEFTVFNRWGNIVFTTTDPDILWDGTSSQTGELVTDGTYFYTCRAFTIRLSGLEPIDLSGYISIFADNPATLD